MNIHTTARSLFLITLSFYAFSTYAQSAALPKQTIAQKQGIKEPQAPTAVPATAPAIVVPAAISAPVPVVVPAEVAAFALSDERVAKPFVRLGFGYTHSRWSQFSPRIKDGSYAFDISFEREWSPNLESGLHLNFLSTSTDSSANENVRAFHVAFASRYLMMPGNLKPFAALGIGVGTYRVWSLASEFPSSITFLKHGSGVLVGVLPEVGLRFVTGPNTFFDFSLGYTGYLSAPQWKSGGWNLLLAFGASR